MIEHKKAFKNWRHNAIHLTFPNGNCLSTTWGFGSYSDNYDTESMDFYREFGQSDTCEIMVLQCPDKLLKKLYKKYDFDSVKGYVSMKEWLEIVKILSK